MGLKLYYDTKADALHCYDRDGDEFRLFINPENDSLLLTVWESVRAFDRTQAAELAKILTHYAETGELPNPQSENKAAKNLAEALDDLLEELESSEQPMHLCDIVHHGAARVALENYQTAITPNPQG